MKLFKILILLATVASARGAIVANPFTTNNVSGSSNYNRGLYPSGLIRIGTNQTDLSAASADAILIGQFKDNTTFVFGDGIYIGGANGGEAYTNSIAIGSGAGAGGANTGDVGAISIGHQTDAFGLNAISIGYANASLGGFGVIQIGASLSDGGFTNTITIGNNANDTTKDNAVQIGDNRTTETWLYGTNLYLGNHVRPVFTIVNTNFIQGLIYSNFYGAPIQVMINVRATTGTAAGGGDAQMDLQQPAGTFIKRVGQGSASTLVAETNNFDMTYGVPINGTYAFSNTITTGSGYSVSVNSGQIFVY